MSTWALVPIKRFTVAKRRLATHLSEKQRRRLVMAMTRDVLTTLTSTRRLSGVAVVTNDQEAEALGNTLGAFCIREERVSGYSAAVKIGQAVLTGVGAETIVVIPNDVPFVSPREIELVLDAHRASSPAVTIVPSLDRAGTNCLVMSPPECIAPAYGRNSFRRHVNAAFRKGVDPTIVETRGLMLDIDFPRDLKTFLDEHGGLNTKTVLNQMSRCLQMSN